MNAPTPPESPTIAATLGQRVQRLREAVALDTRRQERRRRTCLIGGSILTAAFVISLSVLTSMAFRLDAQALTEIGRYNVESNLPQSREAVRKLLEAKAPELTAQLLGSLQEALPRLRPVIVRELEENLQGVASTFEGDLVKALESSIGKAKTDLDRKLPGLGDREKIDLLVSLVADGFQANMEESLRKLHQDSSREFRRVESYLTKLQRSPEGELTPREKLDKEIIQTLLKLVVREHARTPR